MPPPARGLRGPFWRVFPWDATAPPGAPYTPEYILPAGVQTGGRFDLGTSPTLYLALEDPAHALAEVLQSLRGRREIRAGHLRRKARGRPAVFHPLARVGTWLDHGLFDALPDLGDPDTLVRLAIRPDELASRDRLVTQRISRMLHDNHGLPGFRWWSAFSGDWHVAVLFQSVVKPRNPVRHTRSVAPRASRRRGSGSGAEDRGPQGLTTVVAPAVRACDSRA